MNSEEQYDVVILGGGLAGLTLSMQLKNENNALNILIVERRLDAALASAHKVGESTVELGTYYLREVLNLADYLDEKHLPKHGLRFYFKNKNNADFSDRIEYGAKNNLFVPSHQIDRGIFENDMIDKVQEMGITVEMNSSVKSVERENDMYTIQYKKGKDKLTAISKWVVDATGRTSFLKRKNNWLKEVDHDINSAWFRIKGKVDVADWSDNIEWKSLLNDGLRRLGTIHLMGTGYWVWIIPLSSENTSIGIVADPRFHDLSEFNSLDKAFDWLKINEEVCFNALNSRKEEVLDFRVLKSFSFDSKVFYSQEKMGVVGEAGAFLDPFYSPGTDFIALANSWMSDLILRDINNEDIHVRTIVYDRVHAQLFKNWLPIYKDKYELFGNARIMTVKITWDFAIYWAIPSLLFTNKALTNMTVLKQLFTVKNSFGERFGKLNENVQKIYADWYKKDNQEANSIYIDPLDIPLMEDLQRGIEVIHKTDQELIKKLEDNLLSLEIMASEIFRKLYNRINDVEIDFAIDPYQMSLNNTLDELLTQSEGGKSKGIRLSSLDSIFIN